MEINEGLRDKHEGVDAGPWLGTILDMEYGDVEMLLSPTGPKSKRLAEDFTDGAIHRGMGVQGKKIAARKFGGNTTSVINIGKDKVKYLTESVLYLGCLITNNLVWDAHIDLSLIHI